MTNTQPQVDTTTNAKCAATAEDLLQKIYLQRGISSDDELNYSLSKLQHFTNLKDIDKATDIIIQCIENNSNIVIVGDYDVDGATATSLLILALSHMGVTNLNFLIPNRLTDGYGLTPKIVDLASNTFNAELLITVDNGIASIEGVEYANQLGIEVIITDHHLAGAALPPAAAIVNPNQAECNFASKHLAGVGVAFYVLMALRDKLQQQNLLDKLKLQHINLAQYLDLVALVTVADLVKLDTNNRILVQQGLQRIRAGKARAGILAMLKISSIEPNSLSTTDIGFAIAPKLNAAGRIADISVGVRCLLEENPQRAFEYALELENLNKQRRLIQKKMYGEAKNILATMHLPDDIPTSLCLYDKDWHQGLVGIIASNIKDRIYRPTVVFTSTTDDEITGSARSITGFHIRDALEVIARENPQLIKKFGGHAMAAGLTLAAAQYEDFVNAFSGYVKKNLPPALLTQNRHSDGKLDNHYFDNTTAYLLRTAAPWGNGFIAPQFTDNFTLVNYKLVGEHHLKMTLKKEGLERPLEAIWFYIPDDIYLATNTSVEIIYQLDSQVYLGQQRLQLIVVDVLSY